MKKSMHAVVVTLALLIGVCLSTRCEAQSGNTESEIDFDKHVAPILVSHCTECHSGAAPEGGLSLLDATLAMSESDSGLAIVPHDPTNSELWTRVDADEMPPKHPLQDDEKQTLKRWIEQGARWGTSPIDPYASSTSTRAGRDWWSLQPLRNPRVPAVDHDPWVGHPVDAFVWNRLHAADLEPSPAADPRTLIRRLFFDLIGLPPTPEQVAAFAASPSDAAYEKIVDELLASKHYGERWGRHWLDVVRFGESDGFERNAPRNNAWHYRDWVIRSLNDDLPYDEFVRQQLIGDLTSAGIDGAAATGFWVAGVHNTVVGGSPRMKELARQDELEEVLGTLGQTFLGLTIHCARCHDHKFDPISQKEFYQMASSISGLGYGERLEPSPRDVERLSVLDSELVALQNELSLIENEAKRAVLANRKAATPPFPEPPSAEAPQASASSDVRVTNDVSEQAWLDSLDPASRDRYQALRSSMAEKGKARSECAAQANAKIYTLIAKPGVKTNVLLRGDPANVGEEVAPAGLASIAGLSGDFKLAPDAPEAERRRKLAEWITNDANPLLARVMVNRIWHYHFGVGIVDTPNDLGFNGGRPTHPDLLEHLAWQFREGGYRMKPLHRAMVTSRTYRQASRGLSPSQRAKGEAIDTNNRLRWRGTSHRLEAEVIRDAILSVSGKLQETMGGPSFVDVSVTVNNGTTYYEPIDANGDAFERRTVYRFNPRGGRSALLDTFDCPDPASTAPRRAVTTTPLQALSLMNNAFVLRMADHFAQRLQTESPGDVSAQVTRAWQLAICRDPSPDERTLSDRLARNHGLSALCRGLFNLNDFVTN